MQVTPDPFENLRKQIETAVNSEPALKLTNTSTAKI